MDLDVGIHACADERLIGQHGLDGGTIRHLDEHDAARPQRAVVGQQRPPRDEALVVAVLDEVAATIVE